jgi:hypothetical protein
MFLFNIQPTPPLPNNRLAASLAKITAHQEQRTEEQRQTPTGTITPTTNKPSQQNPLHQFVSFINRVVSNISGQERTLFQIIIDNRNQLSPEQQAVVNTIRTVLQEPRFAYLAQISPFMTNQFRESLEDNLSRFLRSRRSSTNNQGDNNTASSTSNTQIA